MSVWRFQEDAWQFAVKPELGFLYDVSSGNALKLGLKYYSGLESEDMDGQGYFTISAGFAFGL